MMSVDIAQMTDEQISRLDEDDHAPKFGDDGETSTNVQYKGTNLCMTVVCKCGAEGHVDDYFAHAVRCVACGRVYVLPTNLNVRELTEQEIAAGALRYWTPVEFTDSENDGV